MHFSRFYEALSSSIPYSCESKPSIREILRTANPSIRILPVCEATHQSIDWRLPQTPEQVNERDKEIAFALASRLSESSLEIIAFYRSYHFCSGSWGIFYNVDALRRLALKVMLDEWLPSDAALPYALEMVRAHELFHFQFDQTATLWELLLRKPLYLPYHRGIYRKVWRTKSCFEESLANRQMTEQSPERLRAFARRMAREAPPGYRDFERCKVGMTNSLTAQMLGDVTGTVELQKWLPPKSARPILMDLEFGKDDDDETWLRSCMEDMENPLGINDVSLGRFEIEYHFEDPGNVVVPYTRAKRACPEFYIDAVPMPASPVGFA